jgi:hypothetical protein
MVKDVVKKKNQILFFDQKTLQQCNQFEIKLYIYNYINRSNISLLNFIGFFVILEIGDLG